MSKIFSYAILLYVILYLTLYHIKPEIVFDNRNNRLRQFGVGYKDTTILPLWLVAIILGILSYFIILYTNHIFLNNIFI